MCHQIQSNIYGTDIQIVIDNLFLLVCFYLRKNVSDRAYIEDK